MEQELLDRHLKFELAESLAAARVVNIIGPRQSGKTTLVRDLFGSGRFITLDDEGVLSALESDPLGQLQALSAAAGEAPVIIDEAQRSHRLALALKKIVDERRRMGQFILTGSSNIFTTAHVADSLAGRVRTLTMLPLSGAEIGRAGPARLLDWAAGSSPSLTGLPPLPIWSRDAYIDLVIRGGYPEIRGLDTRVRQRRYRDYVDTLVDRDVADLLKIRKTDSMRRLIGQLAARTGNELNVQDLCGLIGLQRPTMEQYLDILERLSLVVRLGAWASGEVRREMRHPKLHVVDTGLSAALRGLVPASFQADASPEALGGLLESFVHAELVKNLPYQEQDWRLYHWRGERREIDILAEAGNDIVAFEMKAAATVGEGDFRNLRWFATEGPGRRRSVTGILVYLGEQPLTLGERLFALPLSVFWGYGV